MRVILFTLLLLGICGATSYFVAPYLIPKNIITDHNPLISIGIRILGLALVPYLLLAWLGARWFKESKYFIFPMVILLGIIGGGAYYLRQAASPYPYSVVEALALKAPYYFYLGELDQADQYISAIDENIIALTPEMPQAVQESEKAVTRIGVYSQLMRKENNGVFKVYVHLGILPIKPLLTKDALQQHALNMYRQCNLYASRAPAYQKKYMETCDWVMQEFVNTIQTTKLFD